MNMPYVLRVRGALNLPVLRRALAEICARHEVLRTTFGAPGGEAVQIVSADTDVPLVVRRAPAAGDRRRVVQEWMATEARRPFDLTRDRLMRVTLLELGEHEHLLCCTFHHIIFDGWSTQVFFHELGTLYQAFLRNDPSPLPPLPVQFGDYARWQRERLTSEELARQRRYWRTQLAGAPPFLELRTARHRQKERSSAGAAYEFTVPVDVVAGLETFGRAENATLAMVTLAAFQIVLGRHSGQRDFCVGMPVAGRLYPELESLLGVFPNLVAIRADLGGDPSFRDVLVRTKRTTLDAHENQEVPFLDLVKDLFPGNSLSYLPLVNVMFAVQNTPRYQVTVDGLRIDEEFRPADSSRCDLFLNLTTDGDDQPARVFVEYSTTLLDPATVDALTTDLRSLLARVALDPSSADGGVEW